MTTHEGICQKGEGREGTWLQPFTGLDHCHLYFVVGDTYTCNSSALRPKTKSSKFSVFSKFGYLLSIMEWLVYSQTVKHYLDFSLAFSAPLLA
jgi:hypothetical protein